MKKALKLRSDRAEKIYIIILGSMRDDVPLGGVLVVHVMVCLWAWRL